jgi:hypothetical protein
MYVFVSGLSDLWVGVGVPSPHAPSQKNRFVGGHVSTESIKKYMEMNFNSKYLKGIVHIGKFKL